MSHDVTDPTRPLTKPRVLLIDDTEANLVALEAILADMDCELVRATNGNDALRHLLRHEVALMLLDVQMPGMDGYEVASYSRANPATREVPIIFVTATHESQATLERGYGTGAVDFLFKPIDPYVLRSKVRVFLDLYAGKRKLAHEVEARARTQAELELANQALRHFTFAASHDLRAPLRAIAGMLKALDEEVGDELPPTARDFLDRSLRASTRMQSLLDSLLTYARLQRPVSWADVDLTEVVRHAQADLGDLLRDSCGTLAFDALPRVRGDGDRIYQLFLNLIGNALKFRKAGVPPKVSISADERPTEVVLCVSDNGIGIPKERCAQVFEAFRRLHSHSEYEGSGLGLTICQQIVQQHGGSIWLESQVAKGCQFFFSLPKA